MASEILMGDLTDGGVVQGQSTEASSQLFLSETSVGIGTTIPQTILDIAGGDILVQGSNNWQNPGDEAVLNFGDTQYNHIKAIRGDGVKISAFGATDAIAIKEGGGVVVDNLIANGPFYDVRAYGASGNINSAFGSINVLANPNTLILNSYANFQNGQSICIVGANYDGENLYTTVASGGGTGNLTLADAATNSVNSALVALANGTISIGTMQLNLLQDEEFQNGQYICVTGAGANGSNLYTYIVSGGGTNTLQLNDKAQSTVPSSAPAMILNYNKRPIQNAIDAAAAAGGGTVLIPGGVYEICVVGGRATVGSDGSFIQDDNATFTQLDIQPGDIVINLSKQTAGIVSTIASDAIINLKQINYGSLDPTGNLIQHYLVGNHDCDNGTKPYFEQGDWYCFPGIAMKPGVKLTGVVASQQGLLSSALNFWPVSSGIENIGPITAISVDPAQAGARFTLKNLTIQRAGLLYDGAFSGDVGIDAFNHAGEITYQNNKSPTWACYPAAATIDNICISETYSGLQFGTGIRICGWSGQVTNSSVCGCRNRDRSKLPF